MATQVRLFVSAGPPEDQARELLGRTLAELPVNVGWVIKRTPDVDSVPESHLFALLLGRDIVAPAGLELWWALRTEKPVLAYAEAGLSRTPACQAFYHEFRFLDWRPYAQPAALRRAFLLDVGRFLLVHSERYGVTAVEAYTLSAFVRRAETEQAGAPQQDRPDDDPRDGALGAGGGGVILAPGKDAPRGARLVGDDRSGKR